MGAWNTIPAVNVEPRLFGLNTQDWPVRSVTSGGNGSSPPAFNFGLMSTYGCNDLHWGRIHTADGTFNWTKLDTFVNTAQSLGKEVCYVMSGCPQWLAQPAQQATNDPWGLPGGGSYPTDLSKIDQFVSALLARYNSVSKKIQYVQLFNEPQFSGSGYFWGTATQYVDMLYRTKSAILGIDSTMVVISAPAISTPDEITWWNAVGPVSGKRGIDCFTAVGTHPYYSVPFGRSGRGTFLGLGVGGLSVLRKNLKLAGFVGEPNFYATEYGFSSNNTDGVISSLFALPPADRRRYIQQVFISAAVSNLRTLALFSYGNTFGNCTGDLVTDPNGVIAGINDAYQALVGKTIVAWRTTGQESVGVLFSDGTIYEP